MEREKKNRGLSGSTLKIIALITMLIDHFGAVVLERMILTRTPCFGMSIQEIYTFYKILRDIGRVSFPLFCFLLVEGFIHTRSKAKYALRLGIFAIVSEVPFNLAIAGKIFVPKYQNIFFTLCIGFFMMWVFSLIEERWKTGNILKLLLMMAVLVISMQTAWFLKTDYDYLGIISIAVLYLFRVFRPLQMLCGAVSFMWEMPAPLAFVPAYFYNGERGLKLKYLFYAFYPVHLLLLYFVAVILGIA